jgi:hypothetical protein
MEKELAEATRFVIPEPTIRHSPAPSSTVNNNINSVNTTIFNGSPTSEEPRSNISRQRGVEANRNTVNAGGLNLNLNLVTFHR